MQNRQGYVREWSHKKQHPFRVRCIRVVKNESLLRVLRGPAIFCLCIAILKLELRSGTSFIVPLHLTDTQLNSRISLQTKISTSSFTGSCSHCKYYRNCSGLKHWLTAILKRKLLKFWIEGKLVLVGANLFLALKFFTQGPGDYFYRLGDVVLTPRPTPKNRKPQFLWKPTRWKQIELRENNILAWAHSGGQLDSDACMIYHFLYLPLCVRSCCVEHNDPWLNISGSETTVAPFLSDAHCSEVRKKTWNQWLYALPHGDTLTVKYSIYSHTNDFFF